MRLLLSHACSGRMDGRLMVEFLMRCQFVGNRTTKFSSQVDSLGTYCAKFDVRYDSLEDLKNGKVTELPSQVAAYQFVPKEIFQGFCITLGQWFASGAFDLTPSKVLPGLKPLTVKEALEYK
ncbi:hypothetical protein EDB80DRAFT_898988 [Ilyonectria destructans]|nr:hypothetical protein EDB80DRAFT_898988 [Ilyonectria destructans]